MDAATRAALQLHTDIQAAFKLSVPAFSELGALLTKWVVLGEVVVPGAAALPGSGGDVARYRLSGDASGRQLSTHDVNGLLVTAFFDINRGPQIGLPPGFGGPPGGGGV